MKQKTNWFSNTFEELFRDIQGVLALSYVLLIVIGMINEAIYFWVFGINIFEYSEVFDFLVAPFKKVTSLVMLLFIFIVSAFSYWLDIELSRRYKKIYQWISLGLANKAWYNRYRFIVVLVVFLLLWVQYSLRTSELVRENILLGKYPETVVVLDSDQGNRLSGVKIGANFNFIFLLDTQQVIHILPIHSQVEQIEWPLKTLEK